MSSLRHPFWHKALASTVSFTVLCSCMVKPHPISDSERQLRANETLSRIFADQEPVGGPISLYEAQARAIKYNLDARVKMFDTAVSKSDLTTANLSMLPHILANAGYSERSNEAGSRSESILTGATSLDYSRSSDRTSMNNNLALSWDFLDFGIGYLRAKQRSDQVLISNERRRAIVQGILRDVRIAYWKAAVAERMSKRIGVLLSRAELALNRSAMGQKEGLVTPLDSLNYQKSLLVNINELRKLLSSLATAKLELASLINIRPGENFNVISDTKQLYQLPDIRFRPNQLENFALINRPEIREEDYQQRIRKREIQQSWLRMIPGVSANLTVNHEQNRFLYNQNWMDLGFKVVFDVLAPITRMQDAANGKLQMQEVEAKRDALTVAILAQVNIAYAQHKIALDRISLVEKLTKVNNDIYLNSQRQEQAGTASEQKVIDDAVNSLFSDLQRDFAYADLQHSFGQLLSSIGMDVVPDEVQTDSVSVLASAIETQMNAVAVNSKISRSLRTKDLPELAYINPQKVDTSKDSEILDAGNIPTPVKKESANKNPQIAINNDPRNRAFVFKNQKVEVATADFVPEPVAKPMKHQDRSEKSTELADNRKTQEQAHAKPSFFKFEFAKQTFRTQRQDQSVSVMDKKMQVSAKIKAKTRWIVELSPQNSSSEADYLLYSINSEVFKKFKTNDMGIQKSSGFMKRTTYSPYYVFNQEEKAKKAISLLAQKNIENSLKSESR